MVSWAKQGGMKIRMIGALLAVLALPACVDLSAQTRWQRADRLAGAQGWQKSVIPAGPFSLASYTPVPVPHAETLTLYIEGDGLAWLSSTRASDDPTPRNPVGLELALRHRPGAVAYLARPCQYVAGDDARNCRQAYWTDRRFSPEVIEASDRAIGVLKQKYGAQKLVLVGYSGGGAVAALVAARRHDVVRLVTVAGNLDPRAWTALQHLSPLTGSLDPVDEWRALLDVPQWHFVGGRDTVISRAVTDAYVSRFPHDRQPKVIEVPDFDHVCCWAARWPDLLEQAGD